MPIYTTRVGSFVTPVKTASVSTTALKISSGMPLAASPTTAAGTPVKVLQAWDKASPRLGSPQTALGNQPFFPVPGSQYTANPAAVTTPNELGVHAATLPERNQESYMEQLNEAYYLVCLAYAPWTSVSDKPDRIRQAIDRLQSLVPNLPPDQQKAVNQIIGQLQSAYTLLKASPNLPFGNPTAYLEEAMNALNDMGASVDVGLPVPGL